jgi:5,10-methylene-tetrahydrofolate dehydrogenase/methenyl tetrahydrofolate cyclohydrolase
MSKKIFFKEKDAKRLGITPGKMLFEAEGYKTEVVEVIITKEEEATNATVKGIIDQNPFAQFSNN